LGATLLLAGTLVACGGGSDDGKTNDGGGGGDTKVLTMWAHTDPNYQEVAKKNAAAYQEETGIEIKLTFVPWDQMGAKITAAFQAGTEPDIIQGVSSWLYAQKAGGQLDQVPADLVALMDGMAAASLVPCEYKGNYFGVPLNVNIDGGPFTIYNVADFAEAGVEPGWDSWDAYIADLQKLTVTSGDTITRSGLQMMGGDLMVQYLSFFLQAGGEFYSEDGRSVQINNEYGAKALQVMYDLLNVYKVDSTDLTDFAGVAVGTASTVNYGPWYTAILESDFPDLDWGWARLPTIPDSIGPYFPGTNVWAWMVADTSQNKEAAWDYVRWLGDEQRLLDWSVQTGEIPAVKALWTNPAVAENPRLAPWFDVLDYQVAMLSIGQQDVFEKVINDMVEEVLRDQVSIEEGLAKAEEQLNQMMASLPE